MKFSHIIGKTVSVTVDRPLGSVHPKHKDIVYAVNYGYVSGILGGDGEWQDAYILGVDEPLQNFEGTVVAVIVRRNDNETKWVVAPQGQSYSVEQISQAVNFQEQYFEIEIHIK